MKRVAVVSGACGGIGSEISNYLASHDWHVIGLDQLIDKKNLSDKVEYFELDLNRICVDLSYRVKKIGALNNLIPQGLDLLVNNAAVQKIESIDNISINDWCDSINVNATAPFILIKLLLAKLEKSSGSVINISSIHARLTKPKFFAYATSKAAIEALTRSLAIELGGRIRVNAISPAAIETPMLEMGFIDNELARAQLESYHPCRSIGSTNDIVAAVEYYANAGNFVTGSILDIHGGIGSRLHDPI